MPRMETEKEAERRYARQQILRRSTAFELRGNSERKPHWSTSIQWRPGRWDPMSNAPSEGPVIMHVRGRDAHGNIFEPCHYACGDGDGMMPPFAGWFQPDGTGNGYVGVTIVEWQPLWAQPEVSP